LFNPVACFFTYKARLSSPPLQPSMQSGRLYGQSNAVAACTEMWSLRRNVCVYRNVGMSAGGTKYSQRHHVVQYGQALGGVRWSL
jgi:hypothetical protein